MKKYDEYQKLMRYKCGYYSFIFLNCMLGLNAFLGIQFNVQWGETKELELLMIILLALWFFNVSCVYNHAYYRKGEEKRWALWLFLVLGITHLCLVIGTDHSPSEPIFSDGKIGFKLIHLLSPITLLSISVPYFIRDLIDKKKDIID